jgi:transglutaminase-like putative cysteine protease
MDKPANNYFRRLFDLAYTMDGTPEGETIGEAAAQVLTIVRGVIDRYAGGMAELARAAGIPLSELRDRLQREWDRLAAQLGQGSDT